MRTSRTTLLAAFAAASVLACGGDRDATSPGDVAPTISDEVEARTGAEPSTDATPCEVLDDELLRASFDIAADAEITRKPSEYSPHPLFTATWPKPNAAELEAQTQEKMSEYLAAKMRGEDVDMPSFRTSDEVSLSLYQPAFDSAADARRSFDASMKRLSEGITGSHEDVEITFQSDLTPVAGVGDAAMWAADMHQLSVVAGNRIFHLVVNTGAELDAELAKAREVAGQVAAEL